MRWLLENWNSFASLLTEHAVLSFLPTFIGLLVALPLGALLRGHSRARTAAVILGATVFTIPSLALFVLIPSVIGTAYATALLVRAVLDALDAVSEDVRDAARAMGYPPLKRIFAVDLALAVPVLIPALRMVAVTNVSLVSVGAVIGVGGLGQLFTSGYQRSYPDQILAGIIGTIVLALLFDRLLAGIGWMLTRWQRAGAAPSNRLADRQTRRVSGV